jgi:TetR/AcrR family transcriptional regulator
MKSPEIKALSQEMEDRILLSATRIFVLKGRAGTSMQDIADEAGINRTLLNYYFRSKDNLFELVFTKIFSRFLPTIVRTLKSDIPVQNRLENVIDYYFTLLIENPIIPLFILQELTSNPQRLISTLKIGGLNPEVVFKSLETEMEKGNIRKMDPREIMVNLMSLIIFPFAARKIIEEIVFSGDTDAYTAFILQRKENLKTSFIQSLKP